MDWATGKIPSWRLSNTTQAEVPEKAIDSHGSPKIMHTNQGGWLTDSAWTTAPTESGIRVPLEGEADIRTTFLSSG